MNLERVRELTKQSLILIVTGTLFFLFSYLYTSFTPSTSFVYNDPTTFPRGIIESLFIFDGFGNIGYFVFLITIYMVSNLLYETKVVLTRTIYSTLTIFIIGIMANVYWVYSAPPTHDSYGQSGVVFAFAGIVLTYCALNIVPALKLIKNRKEHFEKSQYDAFFISSVNVCIALTFMAFFVFEPKISLMEFQGYAYQLHQFSLIFGVLFALLFELVIFLIFQH